MIKVAQGNINCEVKSFVFSGGEVSISLPHNLDYQNTVQITAHIKSSDDIMKLLMINDAIKRHSTDIKVSLVMPYIPYARQDRVCNQGEALSIKVFCDLINSCNFESVTVYDPHSDVAPALLNNVIVFDIKALVSYNKFQWGDDYSSAVIVAPDAGSNKKVASVCKLLGKESFIRADKVRDVSNGKIIDTVVYSENLKGQNCLIIDDICDGGKTFIELGKKLKEKGAGRVGLFVTHGIFSKGKEVFDGAIDDVYSCFDWTEIK